MNRLLYNRRQWLASASAGVLGLGLWPVAGRSRAGSPLQKAIPSSGEPLPVIGMGTWRTFNVGEDPALRDERTLVLKAFFSAGGRIIDSSPMYGSSQDVVGYGLEKLGKTGELFSADKIWTRDGTATVTQFEETASRWMISRFDLMQVHNLLAWRQHLPALRELKQAGRVRYVGITTSHGRRHRDLEALLKAEPIDFLQLTYNIIDREVEERLLPMAEETGIAVMVNRPFRGGPLLHRLKSRYPDYSFPAEFGCASWPEFLLKYVVSHPAVTCAIPATSRVDHMMENMTAGLGVLPEPAVRKRMLEHFSAL